jgi:hypothetical protein
MGMIELPPTFAVHCVKGRWLVVAPAEHEFRARTYERMEVRAVDSGKLDISRPAANDNDDRHPHHQA